MQIKQVGNTVSTDFSRDTQPLVVWLPEASTHMNRQWQPADGSNWAIESRSNTVEICFIITLFTLDP
ncbi:MULTISPECIES: hypothetical protein [unclassified Chamaesiphon]|uniref:hypothetical protein n=1 Tax=unclassified Chamaesiphon TaxID=2620921 RepID=UPI00286B2FAB|nr:MULTISPECIES: hypothetical protein [unclassified Chamaesiphon]